jgi:hypothetical protein
MQIGDEAFIKSRDNSSIASSNGFFTPSLTIILRGPHDFHGVFLNRSTRAGVIFSPEHAMPSIGFHEEFGGEIPLTLFE